MDYKTIGKNIAGARMHNRLTQEQLAEKIDVSTVFICQIENAVRKPSFETVCKLSDALNVTVDSLIGNESDDVKCGEIIKLLKNRNSREIAFITAVVREICSNLKDGEINI